MRNSTPLDGSSLNEKGPVPLHRQLREILTRRISAGDYRPGDRIPSERELCQQYGVSRTTVRQTLNDLVHEGILIRVPAKGTFVAPPKIEQDLARVRRFSETITSTGRVPVTRLLSAGRIPAPERVRSALRLQEEETVCIEVLGFADDDPLAYYRVYLPVRTGVSAADEMTLAQREGRASFELIGEHLMKVYNLTPGWVDQTFEALIADETAAAILGIATGDAIFASTRIIHSTEGVPIEYDEILYRGDRYRFSIRRLFTPQTVTNLAPLESPKGGESACAERFTV